MLKVISQVFILVMGLGVLSSADAAALFGPEPLPVLELTLKAPWSQIAGDKSEKPVDVPAQLVLADGKTREIKVRPRGKSRRDKLVCRFPPLWLDLPKKKMGETVFDGQNKLKLVTHCASKGDIRTRLVDQLWSEYLLYRVLNLLTHASFRVQPAQVTYEDTRRGSTITRPAFLIEHKDQVVARLQDQQMSWQELEIKQVGVGSLDHQFSALVGLFQYFAGNTDFSFVRGPVGENCCHNGVPVGANNITKVLAYDFDSTGFVDPSYSEPLPKLKISKLTQRLYRGFCLHNDALPVAIQTFIDNESAIVQMIEQTPELSRKRAAKLKRFTGEFFKTLKSEKLLQRRIYKKCRKLAQ